VQHIKIPYSAEAFTATPQKVLFQPKKDRRGLTFMIALACRGNDSTEVTMSTMVPNLRSSFGMRCAHCNNALIASEWIEERNTRQVHVWRCWRCDFYFETIHTKVIEDSSTDNTLPSRLVA